MSDAVRLRAFLAVPSDGMWVESARGLQARLKDTLPQASWTKPSRNWRWAGEWSFSMPPIEPRPMSAYFWPATVSLKVPILPSEPATAVAGASHTGAPSRPIAVNRPSTSVMTSASIDEARNGLRRQNAGPAMTGAAVCGVVTA